MIINSNFTRRGAVTINKNNIGFTQLSALIHWRWKWHLLSQWHNSRKHHCTVTALRQGYVPNQCRIKKLWMSTVVHGLVKSRKYITPDILTSIILSWSLTTPDVLVETLPYFFKNVVKIFWWGIFYFFLWGIKDVTLHLDWHSCILSLQKNGFFFCSNKKISHGMTVYAKARQRSFKNLLWFGEALKLCLLGSGQLRPTFTWRSSNEKTPEFSSNPSESTFSNISQCQWYFPPVLPPPITPDTQLSHPLRVQKASDSLLFLPSLPTLLSASLLLLFLRLIWCNYLITPAFVTHWLGLASLSYPCPSSLLGRNVPLTCVSMFLPLWRSQFNSR